MSVYDKILKDIQDCKQKGYDIDYIKIFKETYYDLGKELSKDYNFSWYYPVKTLCGYNVELDFDKKDGYSVVLKELGINITPIQHITQRLTKEEISEFVNYILKNYT